MNKININYNIIENEIKNKTSATTDVDTCNTNVIEDNDIIIKNNDVVIKDEGTQTNEEIKPKNRVYEYDTIVLSGGSVKGFYILGSLYYLYYNRLINNVNIYCGTSIGAILSYLLCIGLNPIEILMEINNKNFLDKFKNFNLSNWNDGIFDWNIINKELESITIEKVGYFLTLKSLYEKFGKVLVCCTYNYTKHFIEYLSYKTDPDIPCLVALRMSCNVPFAFSRFKYNGNYYIDGGIKNNFPIEGIKVITENDEIEHKILGLYLDNKFDNEVEDSIKFINGLITMTLNQNMKYTYEKYKDDENISIIKLDNDKVTCFSFDLKTTDKLDLFSEGYQMTKEYFS